MSFFHTFSDKRTHRHWLHMGRKTFCIECPFGKDTKSGTGIQFIISEIENKVSLSFGIHHLFRIYLSAEDLFPWKLMNKIGNRTTGIEQYEEYIWFDFLFDDFDNWRNKWKGIHWSLDWHRIVFGETRYHKKFLYNFRIDVPMPEGNYPALVEKEIDTWSWKRFKKPLKATRFTIIPDTPIPEPGDGENDWDQGDDAVQEETVTTDNVDKAISELVSDVMKQRGIN